MEISRNKIPQVFGVGTAGLLFSLNSRLQMRIYNFSVPLRGFRTFTHKIDL
jgi:hypothetical protein